MKIWIGIGGLSGGGAEKQVAMIADNLNGRLIQLRIGRLVENPYDPHLSHRVQQVVFKRSHKWKWHQLWRQIGDDLTAYQPDLIHTWLPEAIALPAAFWGRRLGIPVVTSMRRSTFKGIPRSGYARELLGLLPHMLGDYIVSNYAVAHENMVVRRLCAKKGHAVVPNGVDLIQRGASQGHRSENDGNSTLRLVFVGRFAEQKRLAWLIKALSRFPGKGNRSVVLTVFGKGTAKQEEKLRSLVRGCHLSQHVRFEGYVPKWRDRSQEFDYFIFPSVSEGMPNVVVEALAEGLPVVCASIPEVQEIVSDGENGFFFAPDDDTSLWECIKKLPLEKHRWQQLSMQACQSAKRYSIPRMIDTYENLYFRLLYRSKAKKT